MNQTTFSDDRTTFQVHQTTKIVDGTTIIVMYCTGSNQTCQDMVNAQYLRRIKQRKGMYLN